MKKIEMWTDGAAISNPNGHSGAGIVLSYNGASKEVSVYLGIGSNNRAELLAIIEGLKCLKEPCEVTCYSDSQIIVNGITGVYSRKSNTDLWELFEEVVKPHEFKALWIRKDSHENNMKAHKLANQAAYRQK